MRGSAAVRARVRAPEFVVETGGMVSLAARTVAYGLRPPYSWTPEFVSQLRFTIGVCLFPLLLSAFALSFGPAGVQASNFFGLFGALDRMGGAYVIITVREFAPLVVGIILAGAAGTAICADLGAREVREETAALQVLSVDPVRNLVVPRVLALGVCALLFNIFSLLAGLLGAMVVLAQNHADRGPFISSFLSNASVLEYVGSFVRAGLYGSTIAVVCCYKGMAVSGGAEGVARAVNQAVVICFLAIGAIDYTFTQFLLATNPELSMVRG